MRKVVILLVLGMVLVSIAPTAMSVGHECGDDQNGDSDGDHEAGAYDPGNNDDEGSHVEQEHNSNDP